MRTNFTPAQLENPDLAAAEKQLRACVHCGICTATCPTYVLLGDELDGPRGRIQLIQQMLETDAAPSAKVTQHIDRCLSCLACVSACPSGVDYPRLIDAARAHIETKGARPTAQRLLRQALGTILTRRWLLRPMLQLARLGAVVSPLLPPALREPIAVAAKLPQAPHARSVSRTYAAETKATKRVALHQGCVQEVIAPRITAAAIRVLTRHGFEVTIVQGSGCCGALNHHLGQTVAAERRATALIDEVSALEKENAFDAIVTTTSGCGAVMRDYGFQLHAKRAGAENFGTRVRDIAQLLRDVPLRTTQAHKKTRVAYHTACSLNHGMKQAAAAPQILRALGFDLVEPRETLCCGSAGVYNVLQPEIAADLQTRKAATLMQTSPQVIASGNIGCLTQIAAAVPVPVVHTIELIDWATGGPSPF
ncbi:MAG: glycolate oxidase subunit GlcF [Alphaproteobacteria bacterium]|nr:glycolate oxidase subunit GlcF [Alphaproteobacteria bacterium]